MVIDSTPPASTTSFEPTAIAPAAIAIACRPLEQNRLMVWAGTSMPRSAEQRDQPRDVEPLLALGHRAARARRRRSCPGPGARARARPADDVGGELVGALGGEAALVTAADRGANCFGNDDFHGDLLGRRFSSAAACCSAACTACAPGDFGSPHRLTNASRSSSRISSSVTAWLPPDAPPHSTCGELHRDLGVVLAGVAAGDERVDHHLQRRDAALAGQLVGARHRRVVAGARPGRSRAAWSPTAGARGRTTRRRPARSSRTPCPPRRWSRPWRARCS